MPPQKPNKPHQDGQIDTTDIDNEKGKEELHASNTIDLLESSELFSLMISAPSFGPAPALAHRISALEKDNTVSYEEFVALSADVQVLKQSAIGCSKQAREIEQLKKSHTVLRSELDDVKTQVELLTKRRSAGNRTSGPIAPMKMGLTLTSIESDNISILPDASGNVSVLPKEVMGVSSVPRASQPGEASRGGLCSSYFVDTTQYGEKLEYRIKTSLWDTFLLYEFEKTGLKIYDGIFMAMASILNLVLQLGFCAFVHIQFGDGSLGDAQLAGLRIWRYTVGHSWESALQTTGESLVSQICAGQAESFASSALQVRLVQDTSTYLGRQVDNVIAANKSGNPFFSPGFILLLMATMLWEIILLEEFRNNMLYAIALFAHMRSCQRSRQRSILHGIVQTIGLLCRNGPVVLLYWWGTIFVVMEVKLGEMIINCTALAFVLHIDKHLYYVLVPQRVHDLMPKIKPWPAQPAVAKYWNMLVSPLFFCFFVTMTMKQLYCDLFPMYEQIEDTYMLLCGYDQNFIYSQDAVSLWPRFTDTPLLHDMTLYPPEYLVANITELVERRAHDTNLSLKSVFFQSGPLSIVDMWSVRSISTWEEMRPCANGDDEMRDIVRLRTIYPEQIENCSQLTVAHCTMVPPRLFCPMFCHCNKNSFNSSELLGLRDSSPSVRVATCCARINGTTSWLASCTQAASQQNSATLTILFSSYGVSMKWWNTCFGGFAGCPSACSTYNNKTNIGIDSTSNI